MIVVANRFHVHPDHAEEFRERFRNRMGKVEQHEGFVRFELLEPVDHGHIDTETHVAKTYWADMDAFEAWTSSEDFREAHSNSAPEEWFTDENELEIHRVAFDADAE